MTLDAKWSNRPPGRVRAHLRLLGGRERHPVNPGVSLDTTRHLPGFRLLLVDFQGSRAWSCRRVPPVQESFSLTDVREIQDTIQEITIDVFQMFDGTGQHVFHMALDSLNGRMLHQQKQARERPDLGWFLAEEMDKRRQEWRTHTWSNQQPGS